MPLTQKSRFLSISTPLGAGVVGIATAAVHEQLGRLFEIDAELRSQSGTIDFNDLLGQNVTLHLAPGRGARRFFNGIVSRISQVANKHHLASYRVTIVPWLWLLTRTSDCRIFQNKTIPDIIEAVFRGHGFSDFELKLSESYEPREYCVQYRETDFNFVSRLMEEEGIYYYFRHADGMHSIVLADAPCAHSPVAKYETIGFSELQNGAPDREVVTDWVPESEIQPVACALNDFDPLKPRTSLLASAGVTRRHANGRFEVYDYPGEYVTPDEGTRLSGVRLAELQSLHATARGQATARGITTGSTFELTRHPRSDQNSEYLVTSTFLWADSGEFASHSTGDEAASFSCQFTALDTAQTFRPARTTPQPVVQGPQTAIVVGPAGEEIHTDKYGRVKLQFHWDRYGEANENSSCWVRVAQTVAGKRWGSVFLPRIGQEVIVDFLEGDPDRPIITGRVYNGNAMPPYTLPDHKTVSTYKTCSSKGGQGFNELRFEDKKGSEQVFLHGERDLDLRVKHDTCEWVGNDRHLIIKRDHVEHVENNHHETVDADQVAKIGKDRHLKVLGKEAKAVDGSKSLTVKGDVIEVFKANHSEQTTADYYLKATNLVIEAMENITIKVGDSHIAIEASGIKIGTTGAIKVESTGPSEWKATGPLGLASEATAELKSPTTTVKGDALVVVNGGMVQIN